MIWLCAEARGKLSMSFLSSLEDSQPSSEQLATYHYYPANKTAMLRRHVNVYGLVRAL